jgi:hypothetical protein
MEEHRKTSEVERQTKAVPRDERTSVDIDTNSARSEGMPDSSFLRKDTHAAENHSDQTEKQDRHHAAHETETDSKPSPSAQISSLFANSPSPPSPDTYVSANRNNNLPLQSTPTVERQIYPIVPSDASVSSMPFQTCTLCNNELCPNCDPLYDHICGMYLEAARKRNGNALRGNEYMSVWTWGWEGLKNVVVPRRFWRDLDIGLGRGREFGEYEGMEGKDRGLGTMTRGVLEWCLWGCCVVVAVFCWLAMFPVYGVMFLIEDSVWND